MSVAYYSINAKKQCYNTAKQIVQPWSMQSQKHSSAWDQWSSEVHMVNPTAVGRRLKCPQQWHLLKKLWTHWIQWTLSFLRRVFFFSLFTVANNGNIEISKFLTRSKLKVAFEYFFSLLRKFLLWQLVVIWGIIWGGGNTNNIR